MKNLKKFVILTTLTLLTLTAHAQINANPRYIEELKIGGGYGEAVDGGADFEDDGSISTDGTLLVEGLTTLNGGIVGSSLDDIIGVADRTTITAGADTIFGGDATVDIAATYVGQASITTLGTIGTGVWEGTAIDQAYLATFTEAQLETKVSDATNILTNKDSAFAPDGDLTITPGGGDFVVIGEFGVGLTDPNELIEVRGSLPAVRVTEGSTAGITRFRFYEQSTNIADFQVVGSTHASVPERNWMEFVNRSANGGISFWTNSTERFSIDSAGNTVLTGDLAVNGGDQTTSAATFALLNVTPTTINAFGAATTFTGGAETGTWTIRNAEIALDGATITSDEATVALFDTTPTKIDFGGAAAIDLSGAGLATIVKGTLNVDQAVTFDSTFKTGDGGVTNYTDFAADGFQTLVGTARAVLEHKVGPVELLGPGPGNNPAGPTLTGHTLTLDFDSTNDEEVFHTFELPHDWDVGTTIKANFHWAPIDANGGDVTWGVETKILTPETDILTKASSATQIVVDATQTTQDEMLVSDYITIDTSGASAGDFLALRIFRDANASEGGASDTYATDAQLVEFHLEYIVNKLGSDEAW